MKATEVGKQMMLKIIKDSFAGHLTIFGIDCFFAFSNGYSLKIIPKAEDIELLNAKCKERGYNFDSLGWIHAVDDCGNDIAFLLSERQMPMCYHKNTLTLITDIILQTSNFKGFDGQYLYDYRDLKGFTAMDFTGNAVNAVFSPKAAIKNDDIADNRIEWLPTVKYAKSFSTELDGTKCNLIFSVIVDRHDLSVDTIDLGELHSVIRLEFDERQNLSMIETCWQAVCALLSFCVGQFNVTDVRVGLWDENKKIGIAGFESLIHCKINNDKVEGVEYRYPPYYRFQLEYFGDKLGSLFKLLNCKETKPMLNFLPRTNIDYSVDRNKIRDLCTALEVEFDYHKEELSDPVVAALVDKLKEVVKDFKNENPGVLDNSTYDYVHGSLGLISSPAKEKLWRVYSRYAAIIAEEIKLAAMTPVDCIESQTRKDIGWLVKVRNRITHSVGFTESEIPNAIYARLKIAVYCSVFERSGFSLQETSDIIKKYFGR
jgi:hypothetical protein